MLKYSIISLLLRMRLENDRLILGFLDQSVHESDFGFRFVEYDFADLTFFNRNQNIDFSKLNFCNVEFEIDLFEKSIDLISIDFNFTEQQKADLKKMFLTL